MSALTELRLSLLSNGYVPLPAKGKRVLLDSWSTLPVDRKTVIAWEPRYPGWRNTGTRTPGLDADIRNPEAAEAVRLAINDWIGDRGVILRRIGEAPKFLVPFRVAVPFTKILCELRAPNGAESKLEFLCAGQQFIAAGVHPDTRKPYRWCDGLDLTNTPCKDLPAIDAAEAGELMSNLSDLLVEKFGYVLISNNSPEAVPEAGPAAPSRPDYAVQLGAAKSGADVNNAQSKRILSLLNRAEHPDDVEETVLSETMGSRVWSALSYTEKREVAAIRARIRSSLRRLNSEYNPDVATLPNWLNGDFHVEFCRIVAAGGRPALTRPGHVCKVIDTKPKPAGANARAIPLTMSEWLARKFPPRDELMGAWLTTTSRLLLSADTGIGKTSLVLAILIGMAAGRSFLHWKCRRISRVLFIDGEMSGEWLQVMLQDAQRRIGLVADNLCCLSSEDYPGMPPFNTKEGFAFLRGYIDQHGPFDLIGFDNIMSLSIGNPKDPEAWQAMLDLIAWLSRARVGQLWVNHTGHDTTRGYGDKAKGWRMTSIIHMDQVERPDTDVSFELKFTKARERNPSNRADFQPVKIALVRDAWTCDATGRPRMPIKPGSAEDSVNRLLIELATSDQAIETDGTLKVVSTPLWRDASIDRGYCSGPTRKNAETAFYKVRARLVNGGHVRCEGDYSWPI
jgi:hypothetical protein